MTHHADIAVGALALLQEALLLAVVPVEAGAVGVDIAGYLALQQSDIDPVPNGWEGVGGVVHLHFQNISKFQAATRRVPLTLFSSGTKMPVGSYTYIMKFSEISG